jgi:hypothetical protein
VGQILPLHITAASNLKEGQVKYDSLWVVSFSKKETAK